MRHSVFGNRAHRVAAAMSVLGFLLLASPAAADFGEAFDLYVAEDFGTARRLIEPDADRGHPAAQWLLGTMYLLG